jgi:WD40 repeat protein
VSLFKKDHLYGDKANNVEWQFNGKQQSHQNDITGLSFGEDYDENDQLQTRLFSVGLDRRCFEYNVADARLFTELPVKHHFNIENEAHPTTCIWYPKGDIKEDLLLTVNDDYKMKLWNPKTQNSRRTCLGPTYGGEIKSLSLLQIPNTNGIAEPDNYLIYSTGKKVVGLIKLPLDGNPHKTMGLVAHPGDVTDICASADGKYIFTCGGDDLAVNMWSVDVAPINEEIELYGGDTTEPFVNLIEGGREGQTYQDMNDFFVYAMIRSMKEDTTKTRKLEGTVPVD